MKTAVAIIIAGAAIAMGAAAVVGQRAPAPLRAIQPFAPAWTETKWPYPMDQWGVGRAFVCMPTDCGARVDLYVRPKIGFCNCATGVSDDAELERVSDTELVSRKIRAQGPARPVKVGWMHGLSRSYWVSDGETNESLLSVGFNDQCDVVVAVAKLADGDPATLEPTVIAFLNTNPMVLWAKKELGLEFIRREW
jgi:hypothetical protein